MTGLRVGRWGFDFREGLEFSILATASKWLWSPPSFLRNVSRVGGAVPPVVKRPEREANQSSLSNAKVKNAWSYASTPQ